MNIQEWIGGPAIKRVTVVDRKDESEFYIVGQNNVTRIEATCHGGLHCDIPYVRIWRGDHPYAEFCLHVVAGVYFS